MLLSGVFLAYLILATMIDSRASPGSHVVRRPLWAQGLSLTALTLLFLVWFAPTGRPIFAAISALITIAIVVEISNLKYRDVLEPVNVMDFTLLRQIWRHPRLYRAEFLRHWLFWVGIAMLIAVIAGWFMLIEVSVLGHPDQWGVLAAMCLATALAIGWVFVGPLPRSLIAGLKQRVMPPDVSRDVSVLGFAGATLAGIIAYRDPPHATRTFPQLPLGKPQTGPPVVIVVQAESFVDLARIGLRDIALPGLAEARSKAALFGPLTVPVQGAWTLRCEFSFLTGLPVHEFGFDALHPYRRMPHPRRTIAHHFRDHGFRTVFVHPFDLTFFNRHVAMPQLGFDTLIGEETFSEGDRDGYYVSDRAVADLVLRFAESESSPLFCMVATMENHNPWQPGRLPNINDPVEQYIHHLQNSDRMIARLMRGIEAIGRPAVLVFYGDHVPTLHALAEPFPDTRTDYFIAAWRSGGWLPGEGRVLSLDQLAEATVSVYRTMASMATVERARASD